VLKPAATVAQHIALSYISIVFPKPCPAPNERAVVHK